MKYEFHSNANSLHSLVRISKTAIIITNQYLLNIKNLEKGYDKASNIYYF
jgi:hypothetical protein